MQRSVAAGTVGVVRKLPGARLRPLIGVTISFNRVLPYTSVVYTRYTAVLKQDGDWWIGWIEQVPGANCQEPTRETLLESLKVTLRDALALNREDAIDAAGDGFEELEIDV